MRLYWIGLCRQPLKVQWVSACSMFVLGWWLAQPANPGKPKMLAFNDLRLSSTTHFF